ncbi:MAG: right-handed parallel beta-helix repeat-containing protein [Nanoarchaeota archaeon]|nr:right-handed parallel beta-helix repeat-containing protein [Nanoarchaeota archaeon]
MKRLGLLVVFFILILVSQGFTYNVTAEGHYCHNCTDCEDAINNNTHVLNTTYLNMSISTVSTCINTPENFTNITFDCQGYSIDGDDGGGDSGIYIDGKNNNTIQNCIITDFWSNIILYNSTNNSIINNTANSGGGVNNQGIYDWKGGNSTFINNTANSNAFGIWIRSGNSTLINNTANSNSDTGIYIQYSVSNIFSNVLINNTANSNAKYGIFLDGSSYNTLFGNIANENTIYGIYDYLNTYNTFTNNTANSNLDAGIMVMSSLSTFTNNTANSNSNDGLYIYDTTNIFLRNNTLISNKYGIRIKQSENITVEGNVMNENTFNLYIWGISTSVSQYNHTIDTTNTINEKTVYYYHNVTNITINNTHDPGFVGCYGCENFTVRDITLTGNSPGILFADTSNSNITNCTIGLNNIGVSLTSSSDNNTISNSLFYSNNYSYNNYGLNNRFLNNNFYMTITKAPSSGTWYSYNYTDFSFIISNLYTNTIDGNTSASLYLDGVAVRTNTTIYGGNTTNFTYSVTAAGSHTYYFYINDTNTSNTYTSSSLSFGIKYSNNVAGCTLAAHCQSGYCVHGTCRESNPYCGDGYCDYGETSFSCSADCGTGGGGGGLPGVCGIGGCLPGEGAGGIIIEKMPIAIVFPETVIGIKTKGIVGIPIGGATLPLIEGGSGGSGESGFGTSTIDPSAPNYPIAFVVLGKEGDVNILETRKIDPVEFGEIKCYDHTLVSYEIEIEGEDKYLCLDITRYEIPTDVIDVGVYKFENNKWDVIESKSYDGKLCGRVTSTPYMITGYQTSDIERNAMQTIQQIDDEIGVLELEGKDTTAAQEKLDLAIDAYWSCEYSECLQFAGEAQREINVQGQEITEHDVYYIFIFGAFAILGILLYIFRKQIKL